MKQLLMASAVLVVPALAHAEGIVVLAITCARTAAGSHVQGELRNDTNQGLNRVRVTGSFRDASGQFINKGSSLIDFKPLLPGQTSPFDFYGDVNPAITQVTVVVSMNDSLVASSGVDKATCR